MNNYHIYEEIGRGKYSVVYKVWLIKRRADARRLLNTWLLNQSRRTVARKSSMK